MPSKPLGCGSSCGSVGAEIELKRIGDIAYREAVPTDGEVAEPVLCVHGWPQSSYMWRHLLPAVAAEGRRAIALDLPGFGESPPVRPGTWERQADAVEGFRTALGLERVALVVHDTGGAIGLRWALDHRDPVASIVMSNTGIFPDYEWHEIGLAMRTEGQGEALVDSLSRDAFATLIGAAYDRGIDDEAIDEYWKAFATEGHRRAMLELYRSFDPEDLAPYEARLGELGVPALVLWGEADDYLPRDYAARLAAEIPGAELVMLPDARHFLYEDEPERCAREVVDFLRRVQASA
jgi:haloalkane dehalogenase